MPMGMEREVQCTVDVDVDVDLLPPWIHSGFVGCEKYSSALNSSNNVPNVLTRAVEFTLGVSVVQC